MASSWLYRYAWVLGILLAAACGSSGEEGVIPPDRPPVAPTGLVAVADDASAELSWNPAARADRYAIYYATSPGVDIAKAAKVPVSGSASVKATVSGLANEVLHYFVVTAINAAGESPPSAEISAMPQDITKLPSGNFGLWAVDDPTKFRYDPVEGVLRTVPVAGTASPVGFARLHSAAIDGTWSFDFRFEDVGPALEWTIMVASKAGTSLASYAPLPPAYGLTVKTNGDLIRVSPVVITRVASWTPDKVWHRMQILRTPDGNLTWTLDGVQVTTFPDTTVTRSDFLVVGNTNQGVAVEVRRVQRPEDFGPWAVDKPAKFLYDAGSGILSTVPDAGSARPSAFARLPTRAATGEWKLDYRFPKAAAAGVSTALELFLMSPRTSTYAPASPRYRIQLGSDGTVALDRTDASGQVFSLAQAALAPDTAWHSLALSRSAAGQFDVSVDAKPLFQAMDATVPAGSFFIVGNTDFGIVAELRNPVVPGSYGNWQLDKPDFFAFDESTLELEIFPPVPSGTAHARLRSPSITGSWFYDLRFTSAKPVHFEVLFVSRSSGSLTGYASTAPHYLVDVVSDSPTGRLELAGVVPVGTANLTGTWLANNEWNTMRIERTATGRIDGYLNDIGVLFAVDPSLTRSDFFVVRNTTIARIRHVQLPGDFGPWSVDDPARFRFDAASDTLVTVPRQDGLPANAYARLPSTAAYGIWEFEFRFPELDNIRPLPRTAFRVDYLARATGSASSYAPGAPSYGLAIWTDGVIELQGMGSIGDPADTPQTTWIPDGAWHKLRIERGKIGTHTWYLDGVRKTIFRESTATASEFFVVAGTSNGVSAQLRNVKVQ